MLVLPGGKRRMLWKLECPFRVTTTGMGMSFVRAIEVGRCEVGC